MNKIIMLLATTLLWFSGSASAAPITCPQAGVTEMVNQNTIPFVGSDSHCANIVIGDGVVWSSGFEVTVPGEEFSLNVFTGTDFAGTLYWSISSVLNGTGGTSSFGSLGANDMVTLSFAASASVSVSNPDYVYFNFSDGGTVSGSAEIDATSVVPVPAAVWLFGSGLIGLIGLARRRKV